MVAVTLLSRPLEPFAKRDLIPDGVEAGELHRAIGNIGQVVGVHSVQRDQRALRGLAA